MTLRPRNICFIRRKSTSYDDFGRPIVGASSTKARCSIVHLWNETDATSVRHDTSASRGRAEEAMADVRILLLPNQAVSTGDVIEVEQKSADNVIFEVRRIFRRPDVHGRIHHIDVSGELFKEG